MGGDARAFIARYDFEGGMVWTRYFEAGANVFAESVSADSAAVYVVGTAWPRECPITGCGHGFVIKFDSEGNELWERVESRVVSAISVGSSAIYVAEFSTTLHIDSPVINNAFVTAIDFDGSILWTRQITHDTCAGCPNLANGISVGPAGIYVVGTTRQSLTGEIVFGPVSFVRKYDFRGNELWTRQSNFDLNQGIFADSKGAYVVETSFVKHFDSDGNEAWTFQIESQAFHSVSASARGVFVAGSPSIAGLCASPSCIRE